MAEVVRGGEVLSIEDLIEQFANMNKEDSIRQIFIPGKGKFTIVLQEEDRESIASDVRSYPKLRQMINESMEDYKKGNGMTTADLIKSLSSNDFEK